MFNSEGKIENVCYRFYDYKSVVRVRKFSKIAAILFSFFAFLSILDQVRYVLAHGYMDFYLNYKSLIPYVIVFLATFLNILLCFFGYNAIKKESKWIIIIYLLVSVTSIGMGQRGSAVLAIIFVVSYYFIRNGINPGEKPWIGKKEYLLYYYRFRF